MKLIRFGQWCRGKPFGTIGLGFRKSSLEVLLWHGDRTARPFAVGALVLPPTCGRLQVRSDGTRRWALSCSSLIISGVSIGAWVKPGWNRALEEQNAGILRGAQDDRAEHYTKGVNRRICKTGLESRAGERA